MRKRGEMTAFLGKNTNFQGKVTFHGTVRIDGHFQGEISSTDGTLIIGEGGLVNANIHISHVVISGEIRGDVIADKRIDILEPGKVIGNIQAPSIVIDEGAIFEGNCRMCQPEKIYEKRLPISESQGGKNDLSPSLGTIRGTVIGDPIHSSGSIHDIIIAKEERRTGEPIKKAKVYAKCKGIGKKSTKTDDSGYYEFINLEDGQWELKLKAKGYETVKAIVEISGGGIYQQNFE